MSYFLFIENLNKLKSLHVNNYNQLKISKMKHLESALSALSEKEIGDKKFSDFISVEGNELKIKIQDGVIPENGVNGVQVTDLLEYVNEVYKSLNNSFSCRENSLTITKIEEAINWQYARTRNRKKRNVEGKNIK